MNTPSSSSPPLPAPSELAAMIPELSDVQVAFPAGKGIDDVFKTLAPLALQWSRERKDTWGTRFFSRVFFKGGTSPRPQTLEGVTQQDVHRILKWLRAGMGSFSPRHEDKERVCGMLWQTFFHKPEDL